MNKIKLMLLLALILSPFVSAQKITMDVHKAPPRRCVIRACRGSTN